MDKKGFWGLEKVVTPEYVLLASGRLGWNRLEPRIVINKDYVINVTGFGMYDYLSIKIFNPLRGNVYESLINEVKRIQVII